MSLGGNEGDVRGAFDFARRRLESLADGGALTCSCIYASEPWGVADQSAYLNQVVGLRPLKRAEAFLTALHEIERAGGREREARWGPRTLDLDLLSWPTPVKAVGVLLPHPRLHLRRFVLVPWAEIAPEEAVVGLGRTVLELLDACSDSSWVRPSP